MDDEPKKCPNCLGYGCCIVNIWSVHEIRICAGYYEKGCIERGTCPYICCTCNGSGNVSWIDKLFQRKEICTDYARNFKRLRDNILEVEKKLKYRSK